MTFLGKVMLGKIYAYLITSFRTTTYNLLDSTECLKIRSVIKYFEKIS